MGYKKQKKGLLYPYASETITYYKIETKLNKENKKVLKYDKLITISPTSDKIFNTVKIKITSELKVKNEIPFFANKIMDEKVKRSNELDLEKTKNFLLDKLNK